MSFFPIKWQPSNKQLLNGWLIDENHANISDLINFLQSKLSTEQFSYEYLCKLKK